MARRESIDNLDSATSTTYIQWLVTDKLGLNEDDAKQYDFLIDKLSQIEFIWTNPFDENRAKDGLRLRDDFTYETGYFLDKTSGLLPRCSIFEMLVGMADRIENTMMIDVYAGADAGRWFIIFIENMGLGGCTNATWQCDYERRIADACKKFMTRGYEPNGNGGPFPLGDIDADVRDMDFWKQCSIYFSNKFK